MSFSMLEPEEEPRCECFYVQERDEMDREDCPFHSDLIEEAAGEEGKRRRPELWPSKVKNENAA